ncbi:MAG: T9SS type A sorting domain-containing protein [Rhodothermales bacterium]
MHRFLSLVLLTISFAIAIPAQAQSQPTPLHVTDALIRSPEGQAALQAFRDMQESGFQTLRKSGGSSASVGQVQTFIVRRLTDNQTVSVDFTLTHAEALFNLWVETAQLAPSGPVQQTDLDALARAIGSETPAGSFNPDAGIMTNNQAIFGLPPNVDGDGKTDILLHDVLDSYDPNVSGSSAVFGYFDPNDLSRYNFRDIVHLDVMPAMYSATGAPRPQTQVQQTLAHEFQHLIFYSAQTSANETFIDEGLAEWAEVQNGYTARSITYLSTATEWNQSMLNWRLPGGGPNQNDYQRAGLFTNYLSERIGVTATGRFSRSSGQGVGKYVTELNALTGGAGAQTLRLFVQGFHVANAVNDLTISPDYGHAETQYAAVRADGIQTVDGQTTNSSTGLTGSLNPGGVRYFRWTDVGDFTLEVQAATGSQATRLAPLVLFLDQDGSTRIAETEANSEGIFEAGNFSEVLLVLPHVDLTSSASVDWTVNASWQDMSSEFSFTESLYDTGSRTTDVGYFTLGTTFPVDSRIANRFETPADMRLESVDVGVWYKDMFEATSSTIRNFRLRLFKARPPVDGRIYPGDEVLSLDVTDTSVPESTTFTFHRVTLSDEQYEVALKDLGATFFVGIENAGTDDNDIYVGMSSYSGDDNPGVLFFPFNGPENPYAWSRFQDINIGNGQTLGHLVAPIRARFSDRPFSVSTDHSPSELPSTAVLDQNWPNPFNPTTAISFELAQSGPVRLTVHDLLGREVAVLVDGVRPAGLHQVRFDASAEASGLYLYTLETPTSRQTRRMLLVK